MQDFMLFCSLASRTISDFALALRCVLCVGFEVCPLCAGFEVCPLSVAVSDTALCLKCDGAVFEVWPLLTLPNLRLNLNGAVFGVFGLF